MPPPSLSLEAAANDHPDYRIVYLSFQRLPGYDALTFPQVLKNLQNARVIWGEHSRQYTACKQLAEASLLFKTDTVKTTTHDDLVAKLEALALAS